MNFIIYHLKFMVVQEFKNVNNNLMTIVNLLLTDFIRSAQMAGNSGVATSRNFCCAGARKSACWGSFAEFIKYQRDFTAAPLFCSLPRHLPMDILRVIFPDCIDIYR